MARTIGRNGLTIVSFVFVACVFVQFFLAGLGVFADSGAFATHRDFGYTFELLTLLMVILAAIGRMGRRVIALTVLTIVMFILQSVFIAFRTDYPMVAALHPVNGAALLVVAIAIARAAFASRRAPGDAVA